MRDRILFVLLLVSFAAFFTTHVLACVSLMREMRHRRERFWGAKLLLALLVVPFAPYFLIRAKRLKLAAVWIALAVFYFAVFVIAWR